MLRLIIALLRAKGVELQMMSLIDTSCGQIVCRAELRSVPRAERTTDRRPSSASMSTSSRNGRAPNFAVNHKPGWAPFGHIWLQTEPISGN